MDSLSSVHKRKRSKTTKSKKKPIKVVYISNPMKVKTSASQFRALVQELTGQDAGLPDPTKFTNSIDASGNPTALDVTKIAADHTVVEVPINISEQPEKCDFSFETIEHAFVAEMLDDFPGSLPSSLCCGSSQVDDVKSLDLDAM